MRGIHSVRIGLSCLAVGLFLSVGGCAEQLVIRRENTLRLARAWAKDVDPTRAFEGQELLAALAAAAPSDLREGVPVCAWLCVDPGYNVLHVTWCADRPLPATVYLRAPHGTLSLAPEPWVTEFAESNYKDYVLVQAFWCQGVGGQPSDLWAWLFANTNGCTVVVEQKGRAPIGPVPLQVIPRDN